MTHDTPAPLFGPVLEGRVALVTGGDSGIGAACAKALAAAGARIAITYLEDEHGARETAKAIGAPETCLVLHSDVRDEAAVDACFDRIEAEIGTVDILVNSAGINTYGIAVAELTLAKWENMLRTDLTGTFLVNRRFVKSFRAANKPKGAIINISSVHAEVVRAGSAAYASAKAGLRGFSETLAIEVAGDGITVNTIAPGMILTPMNQSAKDWWVVKTAKSAFIPLNRPGQPEEVANVAVFLASPAGDYFTASTLTIDGGLSKMLALGA